MLKRFSWFKFKCWAILLEKIEVERCSHSPCGMYRYRFYLLAICRAVLELRSCLSRPWRICSTLSWGRSRPNLRYQPGNHNSISWFSSPFKWVVAQDFMVFYHKYWTANWSYIFPILRTIFFYIVVLTI